MNYQYSYFIYPFVINEKKYKNYMIKLLKDKNCELKRYEKSKDLSLYKYFNNKVREYIFSTFNITDEKYKELKELPIEAKATKISKYPCNIFSYNFKNIVQGKVGRGEGIFFKIQNIEIICFKTGICFLAIKTNIEDSQEFSDLLNFNYKFRDINQEKGTLTGYDNILIQTDSFEKIDTFKEFIYSITGSNIDAKNLDIDTERFLTYSYVCIDHQNWNEENSFEKIEKDFIKYANVLNADNILNLDKDELISFSKWDYVKIGATKRSMTLMASSIDINNYTVLPEEYENEYFYTYIFLLYKRIYLKKLGLECKKNENKKLIRKKFIYFTQNLWTEEISDTETGTIISKKLEEVFELKELYNKIKNEIDALYNEMNAKNNVKLTITISVILVMLLIINILNFVILSNK